VKDQASRVRPGKQGLGSDEQLGVLVADADEELGEVDLVDEAEEEEADAEGEAHADELLAFTTASLFWWKR
jgi:hypothetical protein